MNPALQRQREDSPAAGSRQGLNYNQALKVGPALEGSRAAQNQGQALTFGAAQAGRAAGLEMAIADRSVRHAMDTQLDYWGGERGQGVGVYDVTADHAQRVSAEHRAKILKAAGMGKYAEDLAALLGF